MTTSSTREYRSREERRAQIVEATLAILAEEGFHAWTTSALSERVGVSEATIFRHFENKEEILMAALTFQARTLRERILEYDTEGDPREQIEGLVAHVLSFLVQTGGGPLLILSGQAIRISPSIGREVGETRELFRRRVGGLFGEAVAASGSDVEPAVLADMTVAIVQSSGLRWLISGRELDLAALAMPMLRVLWHCATGGEES